MTKVASVHPAVCRGQSTVRRGFSLLELMLVVVIMGLLMGVVIVNLSGTGEKAKRQVTVAKLKQIQSALDGYSAEFGTYPPTDVGLQTLVANKTLKIEPLDGWKRRIQYIFPSNTGDTNKPFDLLSAGGDGVFGTADDVNIWIEEQKDSARPMQ